MKKKTSNEKVGNIFRTTQLHRLTNKFKTLLSMNSMRRKRGGKE